MLALQATLQFVFFYVRTFTDVGVGVVLPAVGTVALVRARQSTAQGLRGGIVA
jgi:hypothetical protein